MSGHPTGGRYDSAHLPRMRMRKRRTTGDAESDDEDEPAVIREPDE
jgi:hypothetical protein